MADMENDEYGVEDVDVFMENQARREEQKFGQSMIATDDGTAMPFTLENVTQKLREGYNMVSVNYEKQKSAKMYSYLTKERTHRGNQVYAPVTYSPLFNPALAGQTRLFKATVKSISTSLRNILGQSAFLETHGINLKVIGGGEQISQQDGFVQGGERVWGGNYAGRNTINTPQGGAKATQTINK